ncbi:MAG: hypothetical protein JOS17DRAFT_734548 [Linnemannia elongata]|nr:MAG: hypothetical protein JOS17DRAFT_734548 [Linnemannia elongata]
MVARPLSSFPIYIPFPRHQPDFESTRYTARCFTRKSSYTIYYPRLLVSRLRSCPCTLKTYLLTFASIIVVCFVSICLFIICFCSFFFPCFCFVLFCFVCCCGLMKG